MKVGVVGFGGWGRIHADSVAGLEKHELAAIACAGEQSAAAARELYPGADVYTGYRRLLERPDIAAVHVVVPSHLHTEVALAALEAGKHVLLEKPMATTLEDCRRITEAAEASRPLAVSVVHELRCSEQWGAVRHAVESGVIGIPHYAMLNLFRFPYRRGSGGWRYDAHKVGSWVLEEPIHFFDLLLWYMREAGTPRAVTAFINEQSSGLSREFTAVVEFSSGGYGVVSQTLSGFEHHQVVEVTGPGGAVRSLWSGAMDRTDRPSFSVHIKAAGETEARKVDIDAPSGELFEIRRYIGDALDAFESGRSVYSAADEMNLIRLCLAAEESARTGRRVGLDA